MDNQSLAIQSFAERINKLKTSKQLVQIQHEAELIQ